MDIRIPEEKLNAVNLWHASMVMLSRPGEKLGVPIYEVPALAAMSRSVQQPYHLLVIEVDDPADKATQDRILASLRELAN